MNIRRYAILALIFALSIGFKIVYFMTFSRQVKRISLFPSRNIDSQMILQNVDKY